MWEKTHDFEGREMLMNEIYKDFLLVHLIAMRLVWKGSLPMYWGHGETVKITFFETYIGKNIFQSIMSNLQVSESILDHAHNHPLHDPHSNYAILLTEWI